MNRDVLRARPHRVIEQTRSFEKYVLLAYNELLWAQFAHFQCVFSFGLIGKIFQERRTYMI